MEHLKLSDGEWKLMKTLWAQQGQTLAELVAALDADTGWSRATIFMMLKRLIAKGAVTMDDSGKFQKYSAAITYSDVEPGVLGFFQYCFSSSTTSIFIWNPPLLQVPGDLQTSSLRCPRHPSTAPARKSAHTARGSPESAAPVFLRCAAVSSAPRASRG